MQRGRGNNSVRGNWSKIHEQADVLSRKLSRYINNNQLPLMCVYRKLVTGSIVESFQPLAYGIIFRLSF